MGKYDDTKECPNCHSLMGRYESICASCHYCTILKRTLDEIEQTCMEETLKVVSDPFVFTEEETVLGYNKLYKKPLRIAAEFDVGPDARPLDSYEDFEKIYPQLTEQKRNTEIIMLGQLIEDADELGGNALLNMRFNFERFRSGDKPLFLRATANVFQISPIQKEEELSEEKFKQIYDKIEIEYKNHHFNHNISVGERNYSMITRLLAAEENEMIDRSVVRLSAILFGICREDLKLLAYYGDPEFTSAQEFLEYQGVSRELARRTEDYLTALHREFYVCWDSSQDRGKTKQEIQENKGLLETIEGKILCDMVNLGKIGALGIVPILRDSDYIYDPWETFGMMGDMDDYPFAVSDIGQIKQTAWEMEERFHTAEAKRIAKNRIAFMEEFANEYRIETDAEDKLE